MDDFCGSSFWDLERAWNTSNPELTPCFESTVLVWIPTAFILLFGWIDIHWSCHSNSRNIPRSPLNILKSIVAVLLIVIQLWLLIDNLLLLFDGEYIYPVFIVTPLLRILSYTFYMGLLLYSLRKGIQSSSVHFVFWFLCLISEILPFRTILTYGNLGYGQDELSPIMYSIRIAHFPLLFAEFILNCWADLNPLESKLSKVSNSKNENLCPEKGSSYLNRILFCWLDNLIWKGFRKPLEYSDLWNLHQEDTSEHLAPYFDTYFKNSRVSRTGPQNGEAVKPDKKIGASFSKANGAKVSFKGTTRSENEEAPKKMLNVLFSSLGGTFIFGSCLKIIPDLMTFLSPQILNLLIAYVNEGEEYVWKGYLYTILLFSSSFFQMIILAQYSHRMYMTGMRVRTGLISAIYRKSLIMSNSAKKESTVGEIVNLMSVDVQKIMDLTPFINMVWSGPLQVGIALYFLWGILGPSVLMGLAVMILLVPVNGILASKVRKLQLAQMKYKDQRVKLMNEILSGIKVLKLYDWEPSFEQQILNIRAKELDVLKQTAYLNAAVNFFWTTAPFLVSLGTFGTYVLWDEHNVLDAQKVFVSLSLFNIMNIPLTFIPMIIMFIVQALVSIKRLDKYMNSEEISMNAYTTDPSEVDPIVIEDGTFSWEEGRVILKNINLKVKEGSLVAIVGTVGAGKSSIISAILGELDKHSGRVHRRGTIAYVAQQAWIQNATLRDNVLFCKPMDDAKYRKVINSCALQPDLEILPAGDKTEIGEKGINLSGGQKQRVSLARAAYNNADVYLLDDPLSAVDSHVGKHIFDNVIGPKGLLKKKTRILVTHGVSFLSQTDQIIVVKDGSISEVGSFQELMDKKGEFSEFLNTHLVGEDNGHDDSSLSEKSPRDKLKRLVSESESEQDSIREQRRKSSVISNIKDKLIEVEKSETESVKMKVYMDYFRAAGWGFIISTLVLYSIFQVFSVGSNLWLSRWSNEPTVNGTQESSVRDMYLGVYGAFGILQAVAIIFGTLSNTLGTLKSSAVLHSRMLSRVLRAPMSFFDTTPTGRVVNRFAKDVDVSDSTLPFNIRIWLNSFFGVLAIVVIICYTTPIFMAVAVPIGLFYYFIQKMYVSTSRQLKRLESVTRSPIYSHFGETITGAATIRAYGMEEKFISESEARVDHNQVAYFPSVVANRWLAIRLETIGSSIVLFAALFVVLGKDALDPGLVGLSVSYALQITFSLNMLVRWTSDVETNIVAVERVNEYSELPQEAARDIDGNKVENNWPENGAVQFESYATRYRSGLDLVLRSITCNIHPGEKVGIVGRTGAGKSSMTLGLFRIIEATKGKILIDGKDISKLGLHDLRSRLTIIPQDPVLFSGSLRLNLDPFEAYTDPKVWRALELSHLKSFVQDLPSHLLYEINEGGDNLSVGQRQLVCLARALLRKTKILILDEATAAVDLDTDDLIQKTIRTEFKDSTVITIAHRLNTIIDSDRVIVLDKGEIREFDKPQTLLENKNSIFYSMAKDAGIAS